MAPPTSSATLAASSNVDTALITSLPKDTNASPTMPPRLLAPLIN
jgi:hypothetical protein